MLIKFEITRTQLSECLKFGSDYFCGHLLQRKVTAATSCKIAIFEKGLDLVHQLCHLRLEGRIESAYNINPRQVALFVQRSEIFVTCTGDGHQTKSYNYNVEGLNIISLPTDGDCTASSRHFKWRTFPQMSSSYDTRVILIQLPASELLNTTDEMIESILYHGNIGEDLTNLPPIKQLFGEIKSQIKTSMAINKSADSKMWIVYTIAIILGAFFILVMVVFWKYGFLKRRLFPIRQDLKDLVEFKAKNSEHIHRIANSSKFLESQEEKEERVKNRGPSDHGRTTRCDCEPIEEGSD